MPSLEKQRKNFDGYRQHLYQLIKDKKEMSEILTFAYRDFLILHPFINGSGRMGQLILQIIYKQLTGKNLIMPKEFHRERNYSHDEFKQMMNVIIATKVEDCQQDQGCGKFLGVE